MLTAASAYNKLVTHERGGVQRVVRELPDRAETLCGKGDRDNIFLADPLSASMGNLKQDDLVIGKTGFMFICAMCMAASGGPVASSPQDCDATTLCASGAPVAVPPPEAAPGSYAVVAPVGRQTVPVITQAPRLTTLDGKTIAVVGGSFMANVTHPEIRRLIQQHYPTARVILLNEIGSAGPFPPPGVRRNSVEEFQRNLRTMGVEARFFLLEHTFADIS